MIRNLFFFLALQMSAYAQNLTEHYRIYFAPRSDMIDRKEESKLKAFDSILKAHPKLNVWLDGHTDSNEGSGEAAKHLSYDRANSVRDWLIGQSADLARLYPRGW